MFVPLCFPSVSCHRSFTSLDSAAEVPLPEVLLKKQAEGRSNRDAVDRRLAGALAVPERAWRQAISEGVDGQSREGRKTTETTTTATAEHAAAATASRPGSEQLRPEQGVYATTDGCCATTY